ncbi:MAG: hypothetical protein ACREJP_01905 [Candidatus Methylomirabilales bacterium]
MDPYLIVFRILHIVAGIAWVGSAFFFFYFVEPTARTLGPDAQKFMQHMTKERKVDLVMMGLSGIAIVAGGFLYWRASGGFDPDWIATDSGIVLTVGAAFALLAFFAGMTLIAPRVRKMEEIGAEAAASGGPPSQEQMTQITKIQEQLRVIGTYDFAFLVIAAVAMSIARYVSF